jgi:hypothetical protein
VEDGSAGAFGLEQADYALHQGIVERIPANPIEGRAPSRSRRSANRIDVYCDPVSA